VLSYYFRDTTTRIVPAKRQGKKRPIGGRGTQGGRRSGKEREKLLSLPSVQVVGKVIAYEETSMGQVGGKEKGLSGSGGREV